MRAGREWLGLFAWEINPVVVKELRQAVRSWFFTSVLLLLLGVLLLFMLVFMANRSAQLSPVDAAGAEAFGFLFLILSLTSLLFIPIYTGVRLALERREANLDLLYVTTLSPGRIVRGKLLCGLYLALLFFSACLPFILLTNLLRGIDLPAIASALVLLFAYVWFLTEVAIFIACLPVSTLFKAFLGLPVLGFLFSFSGGFSFFVMSRYGGAPGSFFSSGSTATWVSTGLVYLLTVGWLHVGSTALISPRSRNRALPLRLYSTGAWLLIGAVCVYWAFADSQVDRLLPWVWLSLGIVTVALVISVSSPDLASVRVRRRIPSNRLLRRLAFPFFSGSAQGLVWCLGLSLATTGLTLLVGSLLTPSLLYATGVAATVWRCLAIGLYAFAYALTGGLIHRRFFPGRPPILAGILTVCIPALWALLPNLVLFLINRLSWQTIEQRQLGNFANVFLGDTRGFLIGHVIFAANWTAVGLLLSFPWLLRQFRDFQPVPPLPNSPIRNPEP